MDNAYLVTDDQLKEQASTALQHLLHELAIQRGEKMREGDYIDFIEARTGTRYPATTWQHYRNGSRLRLPFILLMSYVFKRSIASFFGAELAKKDYRIAAQTFGFVLDDYITGEVAMTIPRENAKSMQLKEGFAKVLTVTKTNNASPELQPGTMAIIDTSFNEISLSGSYLIRKDDKPIFAAITANATGNDVTLQFGDNASQLDAAAISKLQILGKVISVLG